MKRILYMLIFFCVIGPVSAIADVKNIPTLDESMTQTKAMIKSESFMRTGGVDEMLEFSTNLNEDIRNHLFNENRKIRGLAWWDFAVPSLGNWIVGDATGGVINLIGSGAGFIVFIEGDIRANSARTIQAAGDDVIIMIIGLIGIYAFDGIGTFIGLHYADRYNENLKSGLGITFDNSENMNNRWGDLFHVDLVSYSF